MPKPLLTAQEYLARERLADFRSEFHDGESFAMAGGSPRHSLIKTNLRNTVRRAMKPTAWPSQKEARISESRDLLIIRPEKR